MLPPVTYQGGKGRLAEQIVEKMNIPAEATFYDLCCGSGAVSLALVNKGHSPEQIVMVDKGPWGLFWQAIGRGTFDLAVFRSYCDTLQGDPKDIKPVIEKWYREPVGADRIYVFLLLQASAIGGAAISHRGNQWVRSAGFRDYWLPTATSSRRSPVNPMMPMPETIYSRVAELVTGMRGVCGLCADASLTTIEAPAVVYIDPPYSGTTAYSHAIDAERTAREAGVPCWVSEGKALTKHAYLLSVGRAKGGMTGDRKKAANEEWLSYFDPSKPCQDYAPDTLGPDQNVCTTCFYKGEEHRGAPPSYLCPVCDELLGHKFNCSLNLER